MIEIRKANTTDINPLVTLFEAYRKFYRQQSNKEGATKFIGERLSNKDSEILIAIDSESSNIIGFTQLYPTFTSTRMKKTYVLNDLYVNTSNRGQGISKLLIEAAKQHCIETNAFGLLLETERTNIIGNKLYPSAGFTKEESNFYYWINK